MSGGVDSSVAAALLLRQGYDVVGVFMRLGSPGETLDELIEQSEPLEQSEPRPSGSGCSLAGAGPLPHGRGSHGEGVDRRQDGSGCADTRDAERRATRKPRTIRIGHQGCCSINDAADARLVAAHLGIPFYVVNFKKEFGRIIDYFVGEYNAGRTPNPCVRCNDWLKFGKLHEYARQIDADYVASGHYARIVPSPLSGGGRGAGGGGAFRLLRGLDHSKDQSYVLFGAPRHRLAEMLLPIGEMHKSHVRALAKEWGLPVFDKPDSQEICFVPDNDYAGLVARRAPQAVAAGPVVDTHGNTLGEHPGHQHFTIGQRKGLGVSVGHPLYVIRKDAASNTIVVGSKDELRATSCIAGEVNWLVEREASRDRGVEVSRDRQGAVLPDADGWIRCTAKIRYNAKPVPAWMRAAPVVHGRDARATGLEDGRRDPHHVDLIEVRFDQPQEAVAPGQAVVCYDGDVVLCGGWIREAG